MHSTINVATPSETLNKLNPAGSILYRYVQHNNYMVLAPKTSIHFPNYYRPHVIDVALIKFG